MPFKPPKICGFGGCGEVVHDGSEYCDKHQAEREAYRLKRRKDFEEKRLSSQKRGYGHRWVKFRAVFLTQNPFCIFCGGVADTVDHVIPHKGDYDLFWNEGNLQSLCHVCHSRKTIRERKKNRYA